MNVHEKGRRLLCIGAYCCVGVMYSDVMYSGEYDACDVTLSIYPHQTSLKNMPGHDLRPNALPTFFY
jgi:hypothetical protein